MGAVLTNVSLQAYYSYKGLFLWLNWPAYVSNVFIAPVVLVVMLTLTGRFAGESDSAEYYILGTAAYGISAILHGGILQSFYYERVFGTLSLIYASRSNRWPTYWTKGMLHYPNGILSASTSLFFGWLMLDLDIFRGKLGDSGRLASAHTFFPAYPLLCSSATFSIAFRNWFNTLLFANGILLTLTGVIIPTNELPGLLSEIGLILPLTHGLSAVRETFAGASIGSVGSDILYELVVGLSYLLAGGILFRLVEAHAKRTGTYESAI